MESRTPLRAPRPCTAHRQSLALDTRVSEGLDIIEQMCGNHFYLDGAEPARLVVRIEEPQVRHVEAFAVGVGVVLLDLETQENARQKASTARDVSPLPQKMGHSYEMGDAHAGRAQVDAWCGSRGAAAWSSR